MAALRELRRRGVRSTAILIAADSFGMASMATPLPLPHAPLLAELWANDIPTYTLSRGVPIDVALSRYASI